MRRVLLSLLVLPLLAACGDPEAPSPTHPGGDAEALAAELRARGLDRWLGRTVPASEHVTGPWHDFRFPTTGPTRCFDGSTFAASVRPGARDRLAIVLGGGGACWNYETCFGIPIAKSTSNPPSAGQRRRGIFADRPENPLRGFTLAYGDYCDGSIWGGDRDAVYTAPDGTTRVAHHRGLANLSALLDLGRRWAPEPATVVVTGASAGGYGTLVGYILARIAFPRATIAVFNDSGPWLLNPDLDRVEEQAYAHWGIGELAPPDCAACRKDMLAVVRWLLERDDRARIGLFSRYNDFTIGTGYLAYGLSFPEVLLARTDPVHEAVPTRFRRYFVEGIAHTIIGGDELYRQEHPEGPPLVAWFAALIHDDRDLWLDLP